VPIWIEMAPPETNKPIEKLVKAGATAFGFNLEIWDDKLRKVICPGKSQVSKKRYFELWKYIVDTIGKDKVNTALVTGLEPTASALKGIHKISKQGVRITLLPFKPWDTSEFSHKKPETPKELYLLAMTLAKYMVKYDISGERNYGCANCTSCTIEEDIKKYLL
jgi:biotin synthase-related radical SAM superfamily protein